MRCGEHFGISTEFSLLLEERERESCDAIFCGGGNLRETREADANWTRLVTHHASSSSQGVLGHVRDGHTTASRERVTLRSSPTHILSLSR